MKTALLQLSESPSQVQSVFRRPVDKTCSRPFAGAKRGSRSSRWVESTRVSSPTPNAARLRREECATVLRLLQPAHPACCSRSSIRHRVESLRLCNDEYQASPA